MASKSAYSTTGKRKLGDTWSGKQPLGTPQVGCLKKKCKLTWQEHLVSSGKRKGQLKVALDKESGHMSAVPQASALFRRLGMIK
jgi:hypothetical protein